MSSLSVQVAIPFDSLLDAVRNLNTFEQKRLWEVSEAQFGLNEEEQLENDPTVRSQIAEARAAYHSGDFVTLDDYYSKYEKKYVKQIPISRNV